MSCWIKRLLTCLLTYLPGGETSRGELIKGRNVHKSVISTRVEDTVACRRSSRGSSTRLWRLVVSGQIQARHSPPTAQEGRSRQGAAQELQASFQSTILVQIAGEGDTKAAATFFECSHSQIAPTQYRLYGRRFLQVWWPNQQCQSTEGGWLVIQTGLSLTRLTSLIQHACRYYTRR